VNGGYEGMVETQEVLHFGGDIGHIGAGTTPEDARRIGQYLFNETCKNGTCTGLLVCFQAYSYEGKEHLRV
jgi:hypothetical protein